jgi:phosphoribosylformylglycinamidine synthase subunit PurSL
MKSYRHIPIRDLSADELKALSDSMKLSLSREDMLVVQGIYKDWDREPTDVEMEVIAQTWSEHCKHRIFAATIEHETPAGTETIHSLFKTFIKQPSERIMEKKPGFVLSCFHDNAGFIKLDENKAVCLKVETHNHPSAIEPYAGANTGIGGVVRDILGAGKGAKPIANLDVFCFGAPDTAPASIKGKDVIHPLGVMRGVVRGVRDYGNRMGIPTVSGAIQFDPTYIYNPLVYAGTAGVIEQQYIDKAMRPGLKIIVVGGRTGRDGLKGATFSSASLTGDSHAEDQSAVQIGNPIEEKKAADFIMAARDRDLIVFITDCGAGGFSSAAGEMLSETGGELFLDHAPLKEPGLISWQIFLSESQERMVLAVEESSLPELQSLADTFQTELTILGHSDDTGILKIWHLGELVCELDNSKLHDAPTRQLMSRFAGIPNGKGMVAAEADPVGKLHALLADFAICSREPIIREYDHKVQGNTLLEPLAGALGDAPQDGSVIAIDGSTKAMALGLSVLPEWGKSDPFAMGQASMDETMRSLVLVGADPDQIGLLDNFCMGNPNDPNELGRLVECVKGIAAAAEQFQAPFISGKDSFYNYFETEDGPINIPVTFLCSGVGIVEDQRHVTGSSLRHANSVLCLLGSTNDEMGGSVYARHVGLKGAAVPQTDCAANLLLYRKFHQARCAGLVLSAHDLSEGGLAVAVAEMGFSGKGGIEIDLAALPGVTADMPDALVLFSESTGRLLVEVAPENVAAFSAMFADFAFAVIGKSVDSHRQLVVNRSQNEVIREELGSLKISWQHRLAEFY